MGVYNAHVKINFSLILMICHGEYDGSALTASFKSTYDWITQLPAVHHSRIILSDLRQAYFVQIVKLGYSS